jgi:hypothetical protein
LVPHPRPKIRIAIAPAIFRLIYFLCGNSDGMYRRVCTGRYYNRVEEKA